MGYRRSKGEELVVEKGIERPASVKIIGWGYIAISIAMVILVSIFFYAGIRILKSQLVPVETLPAFFHFRVQATRANIALVNTAQLIFWMAIIITSFFFLMLKSWARRVLQALTLIILILLVCNAVYLMAKLLIEANYGPRFIYTISSIIFFTLIHIYIFVPLLFAYKALSRKQMIEFFNKKKQQNNEIDDEK